MGEGYAQSILTAKKGESMVKDNHLIKLFQNLWAIPTENAKKNIQTFKAKRLKVTDASRVATF